MLYCLLFNFKIEQIRWCDVCDLVYLASLQNTISSLSYSHMYVKGNWLLIVSIFFFEIFNAFEKFLIRDTEGTYFRKEINDTPLKTKHQCLRNSVCLYDSWFSDIQFNENCKSWFKKEVLDLTNVFHICMYVSIL